MFELETVNSMGLSHSICYMDFFLDYAFDIYKGFSGVKNLSLWL